jgi:hypothetical protein
MGILSNDIFFWAGERVSNVGKLENKFKIHKNNDIFIVIIFPP